MPARCMADSYKASAKIKCSSPVCTNTYVSSGFKATAWFAGKVHGVVVQITTDTLALFAASGTRLAKSAASTTLKRTSIENEVLSAYSTSASANAEPQSVHQCTGFAPLCKCPLVTIRPKARTISASVW